MNCKRPFLLALVLTLLSVVAASDMLLATSCISQKAFVIRHVCGVIVDPTGTPIPAAQIEVSIESAEPKWRTVSGGDGRFSFIDIPAGHYNLRVRVPYFLDARQSIVLTRPTKADRCNESLQIHMELAGSCTWVSVKKKK